MAGSQNLHNFRCYDLLNNKQNLQILEDKNGNIQTTGIVERIANSPEEMNSIIEFGHSVRTTHSTVLNDTSSRSHAICQIAFRKGASNKGKLILCDLAGSERAQDTQSNNRQRRIEGAEINKSLLALKECIRAMNSNASHIPFRASKLTLVLKDSFMSKNPNVLCCSNFQSKIVMIACIHPCSSSANHTLNTLWYADRLKNRVSDEKPKLLEQLEIEEEKNRAASKERVQKDIFPAKGKIAHRLTEEEVEQEQKLIIKKNSRVELDNDEEDENTNIKDDLSVMKKTMMKEKVPEEFFEFHERVNQLMEDQDRLINYHMKVIKVKLE